MAAELVGRDADVAAVSDLLARGRLVEIVGPGGVGKTAVAIAVGPRAERVRATWPPAACGWPGSRPRSTADDVVDTLVAALNVGGEAALFERLKARLGVGDPRQLRARPRRGRRRSPFGSSTPRPGCGSCAPARSRSTSTARSCSSSRRSPLERRRRRCSRRRASAQRTSTGRPTRSMRGAGPVPLARRPAAGDRARRGPHQDVVDRGDHPPPRRSVRRAERPDQPPTGTPPSTASRRSGGATTCCSPTTSGACGRWPPSPVAHRCRRSSPSSRRSTCRPPRRSTWSGGSPAARW